MKHSLNKLIFGLVLVAASQANAMDDSHLILNAWKTAWQTAKETASTVATKVAETVTTEAVTGETNSSVLASGLGFVKAAPSAVLDVAKAAPGFALGVAKATPGFVAYYATSSERLNSVGNALIGGFATVLQDDPYYTREVLGATALTAATVAGMYGVRRVLTPTYYPIQDVDAAEIAPTGEDYVHLKEVAKIDSEWEEAVRLAGIATRQNTAKRRNKHIPNTYVLARPQAKCAMNTDFRNNQFAARLAYANQQEIADAVWTTNKAEAATVEETRTTPKRLQDLPTNELRLKLRNLKAQRDLAPVGPRKKALHKQVLAVRNTLGVRRKKLRTQRAATPDMVTKQRLTSHIKAINTALGNVK